MLESVREYARKKKYDKEFISILIMMALLCMTATAMATDDQVWVLGAQVNDANTTDGFAGTGMLMLKKREQNEPNQTIVSSFGPPAF